MSQVKDLHLAKKLDDLEMHSAIPDVRARKLQTLLDSAKKVFYEAERNYRERDEELAYVYYMRYFNLLNNIRSKPDYLRYKQQVRQILGGNATHKNIMDRLEEITTSLTRRYDCLNDSKESDEEESILIYKAPELLTAAEKLERLKKDSKLNLLSLDLNLQSLNLITCEELFESMKECNLLIMDCRLSGDYNMSHLTYSWAFNVPQEIIVVGMSAGKLQEKLDNESKRLWSARSVKDQVVLMDWNSIEVSSGQTSSISILMDILQKWDPDVAYRSPIKMLKGGYEYFIIMYPTVCTNPSVQAPQLILENGDLIDDIEYPSIHDITMKDEIRKRDYSLSPVAIGERNYSLSPHYSVRPSIDRGSKLAALKIYEEKNKPIVELMKEQQEFLEKAQENDEQLRKVSKSINTLFEKKNNNNLQELTPSEQQLLYNLMQLESTAEDYKIENNRLKEELEMYKRHEKERQEELTPQEVTNLEETTKIIETKIQERQKMDEKNELEKEAREKQLAITRENKRHMRSPLTDDEGICKPKIPQFDRSVKPNVLAPLNHDRHFPPPERKRDFSPGRSGAAGRGLTGLKNLGNTCYMNSILQCLSNTPQLTEYCITDTYKNYISRTNKTKGHIVEEVAALIKVLWNGHYKCVASKDLRYVIGQYQQIFRGVEQQDSHEFLTILMDLLHCDLQTLRVPEKPRENITASEKAWLEFTKSKESLILHLFYGQMKSTVKCVQCKKESATYECFSNLSLELPSNANFCYLSQCMDMYFSGEHIHGWNCPSCKQKRDAIKKLDISKLPPVLVIHLKRFYADENCMSMSYKKKQNYVRFPLENLDMTPYIARSELRSVTPKTYRLYGVSNHYGSMESGHYTAFCKSSNYERWFKFDDQVVTPLDGSNVVSSAAYILFYTWLPPIQITEPNQP